MRKYLKRYRANDAIIGFLYILPYVACWSIFLAYPVGYGFYLSLFCWDPLRGSQFVGFTNYQRLLFDPRFINAILVSLKFVVMTVPLVIFFGALMAFGLWYLRHYKKIVSISQALFFIPYTLSVSVIAITWRWLLDRNVGFFQYYMSQIGLPVLLVDPSLALPTIAFVTTWWIAGYRMLIFQAALEDIPVEVVEAAIIDGASFRVLVMKIFFPLLKPAMTFAIIFTIVMAFQMFGQVFLMTEGGPGRSTELLALYIYRSAFDYLDLGRAAAAGFILGILVLSVSLVWIKKGMKSALQ